MRGLDRAAQLVIVNGLAADQWGLFTARQAAGVGVTAVHLTRLVDAELLENVGRGIYRLPGAALPEHLEIKVAWLRLDPERLAWERSADDPAWGVVSHGSACLLHGLGDIPAGEVEITVARRRATRTPFVRLHTGQLEPSETTVVDGLPVTCVERTVVDLLRARADGGHVGGVIADAERRDLIDADTLAPRVAGFARAYGLSARSPGRALIDHLVAQAGTQLRRTEVERAVARDIATHEVVRDLAEHLATGARASQDRMLALESALEAALEATAAPAALQEQLARIADLGEVPALQDHTRRLTALAELEERLIHVADPSRSPALAALREHAQRLTAVTDLERSLHRLLAAASPGHEHLNDAFGRLAQPLADAHLKRLHSGRLTPSQEPGARPAPGPDQTAQAAAQAAAGRARAVPAGGPEDASRAEADPSSGAGRTPQGS